MLIGDFNRGWQKNEWRWVTAQAQNDKWHFVQPLWIGSNEVAGNTVLLHAEQGFGDTIQFCRYVPLVAQRGAHGGSKVTARVDENAPRRGADRVQGRSTTQFRRPLPVAQPAVGVWDRLVGSLDAQERSIGLSTLLPLLDFNASYVSLQRDVRAGDATVLRERTDILHFGDELKDFSDTAALISNLDLVISMDTSVAHLAGAMAKPVLVLLPFIPDWRWLLDRDDSPWYPTARLFRQDNTRKWDNVIARVLAALNDYRLGM